MKLHKFSDSLTELRIYLSKFDKEGIEEKRKILKKCSQLKWKSVDELNDYQDILLFMSAYPESKELDALVRSEKRRLAQLLKFSNSISELKDSGLPFTKINTQFSFDLIQWIRSQKDCTIEFDDIGNPNLDINALLKITLPSLIADITTADLDFTGMMQELQVDSKERLAFLLQLIEQLPKASLRDFFWEHLKVWVWITSRKPSFSRLYNCISISKPYYHTDIIKHFDSEELISRSLPKPKRLTHSMRDDIVKVIRKSLLLTMRETDPSTYMDEKSLRYFELERGLSVAIYGVLAERSLPLQSYVGYTLFKNGYPVAYGGSWIFGHYAKFGLNIFEAFRGGESGYIMCQLLRVYKNVFSLYQIEVDSYQFGKDNPDGIKSGAFWFYYRYGFRPMESKIHRLVENDFKKIKSRQGYRTSEKLLLKFAQCNIALTFSKQNKILTYDYCNTKVSQVVISKYKSNQVLLTQAVNKWMTENFLAASTHTLYRQVECELVMLCMVMKLAINPELWKKLIKARMISPYNYNDYLSLLLNP